MTKVFRFLSFLEFLVTSVILFSCALPSVEFSINYTVPTQGFWVFTPSDFLVKINNSFSSVRNVIKNQKTKSSEQEVFPLTLC